jgi:hypothetical protein
MHDVLEFFNFRDTVPLILLICLLEFVGRQMSGSDPTVLWWARAIAGAAFLGYAGCAIDTYEPQIAAEFLTVAVRSLLAMGNAHGLARVTVPVVCFFYRHLVAEPLASQRRLAAQREARQAQEKSQREFAERERVKRDHEAEEKRRKEEEFANKPPPPTRQELMAAAKKRFDETLAMLPTAGLDEVELKAAQDKAKQQFLRELAEAMK